MHSTQLNSFKKESESDVTYSQVWWPILGICALHLTHPSVHTQQWTHTHREHTPRAVGSHLCCGARGTVEVQCLAQGSHLSHGIEGGESAVHSLPPPTIPAGPETRTRNLSITLTIRPRLPQTDGVDGSHEKTCSCSPQNQFVQENEACV